MQKPQKFYVTIDCEYLLDGKVVVYSLSTLISVTGELNVFGELKGGELMRVFRL